MKSVSFLALLPAAFATTLLANYSPSISSRQPHSQVHPHPRPRNYGARADSLNGIPGHAFGEPRSNFPELQAKGSQDMDGYTYYEPQPGKEPGWFGKNADQVHTIYRFYQDKFAIFNATAAGNGRPLLEQEVVYLFGKGQPQQQGLAFGEAAINWEGKRVHVQLFSGHNLYELAVVSKPVIAQKAADKAAQQKVEAAARVAKFRADNAPASH